MTRQIWCAKCGAAKAEGQRCVYEASMAGEPAEYERVVKGIAKQPTQAQRTSYVNGEPSMLSMSEYTCDNCSAAIKPGDPVMAWSVWAEGMAHPGWEHEYLERRQ